MERENACGFWGDGIGTPAYIDVLWEYFKNLLWNGETHSS